MRRFENLKPRLTNSLTGKREAFIPAASPKVLFYSCGPTVYGPLHIGNARALVVADLLFRWLKYLEYDVCFVRNYTDVDDKIINRAQEEKITSEEVAEKYVQYCEEDIRKLELQSPTRTVRVTETMPEIIEMVGEIQKRGHGYEVGGEVLFSIDSFPTYGKLSHKKLDDLLAGARVEVKSIKKNPLDFTLWKPQKPGEPFWDSPWGKGRPGWHIECSAMVKKWLGDTIDIHHGGQDLVFPHHENEIAQSEAASGKEFCRHWVHHAFINMGQEKMSKSLGNIFLIRDFITQYSPEVLKYIFVSHHFRTPVDFSEVLIEKTLGELERIYQAKLWAETSSSAAIESGTAVSWSALKAHFAKTWSAMEAELCEDLNMPGALGHLFTLIREINKTESQAQTKAGVAAPNTAEKQACAKEFQGLLQKLHALWNVLGLNAEDALSQINTLRGKLHQKSDAAFTDAQIQALIEERAQARKNKNFARGDEIRKELDAKGIILVDSPTGTTWKNK